IVLYHHEKSVKHYPKRVDTDKTYYNFDKR
ncbi:unnamed protein product, partial [marine sediment metagenome]